MLLTVRMRPKGKDNARITTELIHNIEIAMLGLLREAHPDIELGMPWPLQIAVMNQEIIQQGYDRSNTTLLQNILFSWSQDARANGHKGLIDFRYGTRNSYQIIMYRDWAYIERAILQRHRVTSSVLNFIYQLALDSDESSIKKVMLSFSLEQVIDYLRKMLILFQ